MTLVVIQALLNGLLLGGVYLLAAIGLSVVFGTLRIVNLAHGDFVMLGGYAMFALTLGLVLPPFLMIAIAASLGIVAGVVIYFGLIDRIRNSAETTWIIVTFGLSAAISGAVRLIFGPTPHVVDLYSGSLHLGALYFPYSRTIAFVAAVIMLAILTAALQNTRAGKAVRALSQNPELATAMGLPVRALMAAAFAAGTCLSFVAGALLISVYSMDPDSGLGIVFKSFAILAIAGMGGTLSIATVALLLGAAESVLALVMPQTITDLLAFFALLTVIVLRPSNVFATRGL